MEAEQRAILKLYRKDIAKYDPNDKLYLDEIFDLIPSELNAQNKRFILKKELFPPQRAGQCPKSPEFRHKGSCRLLQRQHQRRRSCNLLPHLYAYVPEKRGNPGGRNLQARFNWHQLMTGANLERESHTYCVLCRKNSDQLATKTPIEMPQKLRFWLLF